MNCEYCEQLERYDIYAREKNILFEELDRVNAKTIRYTRPKILWLHRDRHSVNAARIDTSFAKILKAIPKEKRHEHQ